MREPTKPLPNKGKTLRNAGGGSRNYQTDEIPGSATWHGLVNSPLVINQGERICRVRILESCSGEQCLSSEVFYGSHESQR